MDPESAFDAMPNEALAAWDPERDFTRVQMLNPAIFRALGEPRGQRILDAGCGQGYLCRLLADGGAAITGVEPSRTMIDYAIKAERTRPLGIDYIWSELSGLEDLDAAFDVVIANMVLMDIRDWVAAMRTCVNLLRWGGVFVFSITHPCFEESTETWPAKRLRRRHGAFGRIRDTDRVRLNLHRPLSAYLNTAISLGCALA